MNGFMCIAKIILGRHGGVDTNPAPPKTHAKPPPHTESDMQTELTPGGSWPRRVNIEIVEKQWGHGILVTRVPAWDAHQLVGHNQEEVPREVFDQPIGTIVHALLTSYGSVDLDGLQYAMPVFTDWEWPGGSEAEAATSPPLPQRVANAATVAYRAALVDHCNEDMHTRFGDLCNMCTGSAALNVPYSNGRDRAVHAAMQAVWAAAWKERGQ